MRSTFLAALFVPLFAAAYPMAMRDDAAPTHTQADADGDGIADARDNCRDTFNPDQRDSDRDGLGDACDTDNDNDGVADLADNCPFVANADQRDADDDGIGDACDAHFNTGVSVTLVEGLASHSAEVLASFPGANAQLSALNATVETMGGAARAWDAGTTSRQSYEAALSASLLSLTRFDTELAARAERAELSAENAATLRDASAGIRQIISRLLVN
jgi:hypothetical protein